MKERHGPNSKRRENKTRLAAPSTVDERSKARRRPRAAAFTLYHGGDLKRDRFVRKRALMFLLINTKQPTLVCRTILQRVCSGCNGLATNGGKDAAPTKEGGKGLCTNGITETARQKCAGRRTGASTVYEHGGGGEKRHKREQNTAAFKEDPYE